MERFMLPNQRSSQHPSFKSFNSRKTKGLNCSRTLNDQVVATDCVNDPLKSSVLEKVKCNVMLQKNTVTSATFQAAARAAEICPYWPSSIDRTTEFSQNTLLMQHENLRDIADSQYGRVKMKAHQIRVPPCLWVTNISAG